MYDGKNTIIVLPQFQIDGMVEVMDDILAHPYKHTVDQIKQKYDLNEDEYHMIYDFCMPHERHRSKERYWITRYKTVTGSIQRFLDTAKEQQHRMVRIEDIEKIFHKLGVGEKNEFRKDMEDPDEIEEEEEEEEDA